MHLTLRKEQFPISFNSGFQPNQKTDTKGFIFELLEGVRTEELSGSNLHKWSKSSYQKEWVKHLSLFTYIISKPD